MKRYIIFIGVLLGSWLTTEAQVVAPDQLTRYGGGAAMNQDIMMPWDFAQLSQRQNFGTSRAMAMGGAFTSLGADLTSMSVNPAGLGMYRGNEFSITPLVSLTRSETADTEAWAGTNRNRFTVGNVGAVINVYESGRTSLTSLTVGFGMNRVADFNTATSFSREERFTPGGARVGSIADVYLQQLTHSLSGGAIFPAEGENHSPNGKLDYANPYFWPAVMGYKSAMIHVKDTPAGKVWERDAIGHNASILRSMDQINSGSINEFEISMGGNVQNIFYFGATIGIQSVYKTTDFVYGEDYGYFNNPDRRAEDAHHNLLPAQLEYSDLWQRTVLDGMGINLKLGVTVRPTKGLRLGLAFHTPTYYTLDRSYRSGLDYKLLWHEGQRVDEMREKSPTMYDEGGNSWNFVSPSRLLLGGSYTLGRTAILSVDYERAWYNGIRVKNTPSGLIGMTKADYKYEMKHAYQPTNTLRAGLEVRPIPRLALRAGGGYSSSMLTDEGLRYDVPQLTTSHYITAGLGVHLTRTCTLDAAYQYLAENQSQYRLFFLPGDAPDEFVATSDVYSTKFTRHFLSLSLSMRF